MSEKTADVIPVFLNLVGFVLWPNMGSILEDVPCVLEQVHSVGLGWNVKRTWHKVSFTDVF